MANIKSPPSVVKHFSTGVASSGKCYINLFIYLFNSVSICSYSGVGSTPGS